MEAFISYNFKMSECGFKVGNIISSQEDIIECARAHNKNAGNCQIVIRLHILSIMTLVSSVMGHIVLSCLTVEG